MCCFCLQVVSGFVLLICVVVLFFYFFFFFFKQKTAYEIVSRDWSSDVCSSDLTMCVFVERGTNERKSAMPKPFLYAFIAETFYLIEIGRASCRERV